MHRRRPPNHTGAGAPAGRGNREGTMDTMMDTQRTAAFQPEMAGQVGAGLRTPRWDTATEMRVDDGQPLARALGWFSLALGALELAAPQRVTRFLGVDDDNARLVQLFGLREIASGIGVLSSRRPVGWIGSRIAGDALDLGSLGAALGRSRRRGNVMVALGMVAGVAALDVLCEKQLVESARTRIRES